MYTYCIGNWTANVLVTKTAQYSALHCFFNFKQNNEYLLISNTLRFICSILLALAFYFILHCFRHTYATLQIAAGTDIFTVSKMLTHKNVATTQIYAELVSEKKRETVDKISLK